MSVVVTAADVAAAEAHPKTDSFAEFGADYAAPGRSSGRLSRCSGCVDVRSITKSVVALAILKLHCDKKLNLADPVSNHLPAVFPGAADASRDQITIDHLLQHWEFSYSNAGYQLLALIVEKTAGERIDTYCRRELWGGWGRGPIRWKRPRGVPLGQSGLCTTAGALAELGRRLLVSPELSEVRALAWQVTTADVPDRFNMMPAYGRGFWLSGDGRAVLGHGSQSNYWYFNLETQTGFARLHLSGTEIGDTLWEPEIGDTLYGKSGDWNEELSRLDFLH